MKKNIIKYGLVFVLVLSGFMNGVPVQADGVVSSYDCSSSNNVQNIGDCFATSAFLSNLKVSVRRTIRDSTNTNLSTQTIHYQIHYFTDSVENGGTLVSVESGLSQDLSDVTDGNYNFVDSAKRLPNNQGINHFYFVLEEPLDDYVRLSSASVGNYTRSNVTYHGNGGTFQNGNAAISIQSYHDERLDVYDEYEIPSNGNKIFSHWEDGSGVEWDIQNDLFLSTSSRSFYAIWMDQSYDVSFDWNDGSDIESFDVTDGGLVSEPPLKQRDGYSFVGWYDSTLTTPWDFSTPITQDIRLYAKWDINTYTVTYNSMNDTASSSIDVTYDGLITEPTKPNKANHTFGGWFKDEATTQAWDFETDRVQGNITLYAKWDLNKYTVSFDAMGGTLVNSQEIEYGGVIAEPEAPTQENYTFGGWFKDQGYTTPWDFEEDTVSDDLVLFAKWTTPDNPGNGPGHGGNSEKPPLTEENSPNESSSNNSGKKTLPVTGRSDLRLDGGILVAIIGFLIVVLNENRRMRKD